MRDIRRQLEGRHSAHFCRCKAHESGQLREEGGYSGIPRRPQGVRMRLREGWIALWRATVEAHKPVREEEVPHEIRGHRIPSKVPLKERPA